MPASNLFTLDTWVEIELSTQHTEMKGNFKLSLGLYNTLLVLKACFKDHQENQNDPSKGPEPRRKDPGKPHIAPALEALPPPTFPPPQVRAFNLLKILVMVQVLP